jgi:hypothetical protein
MRLIHELFLRCRVIPKKLVVSQLVQKFQTFYGTPMLITVLTKLTLFPNSRTHDYRSPHLTLFKIFFKYYVTTYNWISQVPSFLQVSQPNTECISTPSPYTVYAQSLQSPLVLRQWNYLVRNSTNHDAPHYVVFSSMVSLLSLRALYLS